MGGKSSAELPATTLTFTTSRLTMTNFFLSQTSLCQKCPINTHVNTAPKQFLMM